MLFGYIFTTLQFMNALMLPEPKTQPSNKQRRAAISWSEPRIFLVFCELLKFLKQFLILLTLSLLQNLLLESFEIVVL